MIFFINMSSPWLPEWENSALAHHFDLKKRTLAALSLHLYHILTDLANMPHEKLLLFLTADIIL
jgi:hypothetical protein